MFIQAFKVFPDEGAILGRLLTGYTDIEYQMCFCAGMGGGDVAKAITDIYSKRGETRRVSIADKLGGAGYSAAGLGADFFEAIEDMILCLNIRNQYAHCIWHDPRVGKLAFADMEKIASPTGPGADPINLTFKFVNVSQSPGAVFLLHERYSQLPQLPTQADHRRNQRGCHSTHSN